MPRLPSTRLRPRAVGLAVPLALTALALAVAACEVVPEQSAQQKQDTTTAPAAVPPAPAPAVGADSAAASSVGGVPAVPTDSAAAAAAALDTGVVQLYPEQPRRGGVLFALAQGLMVASPRCTWDGAPLPCHSTAGGVLALVPLTADEPGGTHTLAFERPAGRLTRTVAVAERDFGRELIFLDSARYALLQRTRDRASDARALRAVLTAVTPERRWRGRWREPVPLGSAAGYGVERFYYRASDSARAVSIPAGARSRGVFAADTSDAAPAAGDVPAWRHSGVDAGVSRGTAVQAPAAGYVADVGEYVLTGRTVVIDHGQGVLTTYFHLDTALVRRGDQVRVGRTLGRVGDTGLSTGPHLHYGVDVHGKDVDPAAWRDMPAFVYADTARTTAR